MLYAKSPLLFVQERWIMAITFAANVTIDGEKFGVKDRRINDEQNSSAKFLGTA